jgi:hypothetical protein
VGDPETGVRDSRVEEGHPPSRRQVRRALWPVVVGATWFVVAMVVLFVVLLGVGLYGWSHSGPITGGLGDLSAGLNRLGNCPTKTVTATYGESIRLCDPLGLSGLDEMTVYSLSPPTLVSVGSDGAPVQGEVTTADVGVCTGRHAFVSRSLDGTDFELLFADGSAVIPAPFHARQPQLENLKSLGPHRCARGYVSFYTGRGSVPTAVSYQQVVLPTVTYRWSAALAG